LDRLTQGAKGRKELPHPFTDVDFSAIIAFSLHFNWAAMDHPYWLFIVDLFPYKTFYRFCG
jgi:hypothetical protein